MELGKAKSLDHIKIEEDGHGINCESVKDSESLIKVFRGHFLCRDLDLLSKSECDKCPNLSLIQPTTQQKPNTLKEKLSKNLSSKSVFSNNKKYKSKSLDLGSRSSGSNKRLSKYCQYTVLSIYCIDLCFSFFFVRNGR